MEPFGEYMRKIRKAKGLTITELSNLSGVSQPHISNIENGKRNAPPPEILNKLAPILGIGPLELMRKAGHTDEQAIRNEKISFAAQMIIEQILSITSGAKDRTNIGQVINFINSFEAKLISAANEKAVTIPELKEMLWYMEGDGDSMKSTIGRRSESSEIETLLDALSSVLDTEHRLASEVYRRKDEEVRNIEITDYLIHNFNLVTYNGHPLTYQDRQRIIDVLKALFPDYQQPPSLSDDDERTP